MFNPPRRMFDGSDWAARCSSAVQVPAIDRKGSGVDLRHVGLNPESLATPAALASLRRGRSARIRLRISVASGQSGPEHSTSDWRRSSSASGHRIRLATSPPSTRKTMCPRKATRRAGLTLQRTQRAAGASVSRNREKAARPSREKMSSAQLGTSPIMTSGGSSSFSTWVARRSTQDRSATSGHSISLVRRNP